MEIKNTAPHSTSMKPQITFSSKIRPNICPSPKSNPKPNLKPFTTEIRTTRFEHHLKVCVGRKVVKDWAPSLGSKHGGLGTVTTVAGFSEHSVLGPVAGRLGSGHGGLGTVTGLQELRCFQVVAEEEDLGVEVDQKWELVMGDVKFQNGEEKLGEVVKKIFWQMEC